MDFMKPLVICFYSVTYVTVSWQQQYEHAVNVAMKQSARQFDTLYWAGFNWTAERAVDNCLNQDAHQGCCSGTVVWYGGDYTLNYWELTLNDTYEVESIKLIARTGQYVDNQLDGFILYIAGGDNENYREVPPVPKDTATESFTFQFSPAQNVSKIKIRRPADGLIVLCEVQAWVCEDGFYSTGCAMACGGCRNYTACDKSTGVCFQGCEPGYYGNMCHQCGHCVEGDVCSEATGNCPRGCIVGWKGDMCLQPCEMGTYGSNCSETCGHCVDFCNNTDGRCHGGCQAGWQGDRCLQECDNGWYGVNCSSSCGHCLGGGEQCQHVNGTCLSGCVPGWQDGLCTDRCSNNTHGSGCTSACGHCINDTVCSHIDGSCGGGCDPGWTGEACVTKSRQICRNVAQCADALLECRDGSYGENCSETCGHCLGEETCNHVVGTCAIGCAAGWQGTLCLTACTSGTYGLNCTGMCGHCLNGDMCEPETGACTGGCEPGYTGQYCTDACQGKTYGHQCSLRCGQCRNGNACDTVSGVCHGGCAPGWRTQLCNRACETHTYGQDCRSSCGHCKGGLSCDRVDGGCRFGCSAGYKGATCHEACEAGRYSENCVKDCGYCVGNSCNGTNGACLLGCQDGFREPFCVARVILADDGSSGTNIGAVVGGIIGGILVALGIVGIAFIIYKVVRRNRKKNADPVFYTEFSKDKYDELNTSGNENASAVINKALETDA